MYRHLGFWDWKYLPANRGFESAYGYLTGAEDYYLHTNGKHCKGLDLTAATPGSGASHFVAQPQLSGTYSTFMYQAHICATLRAHPQTQPLFFYMPFQSVHEPIQAPQEYINLYNSSYANSSAGRRTFAGMVSALDSAVGNVTATLRSTGLWAQTFLIFSTGEQAFRVCY